MPGALIVGLPEPGDAYRVRLQRCCDHAAPLGNVALVDSLGSTTITASG